MTQMIYLDLTYRCNQRCLFCVSDHTNHKQFLDYQIDQNVLDEIFYNAESRTACYIFQEESLPCIRIWQRYVGMLKGTFRQFCYQQMGLDLLIDLTQRVY